MPPPSTEVEYSGKTMLRMPTYLHKRLAESAKREGTSLNQYLISLLSERDAFSGLQAVQAQLADIQSQLQQTQMRPVERSPYLVSEASGTPQPEKSK
ncbi:MAG: toxin-antitoxin system HicB family antitoxin [Pseudomonadota bacterium]